MSRAQRVDSGRGSKEHTRVDDISITVSPALPTFVDCPKRFCLFFSSDRCFQLLVKQIELHRRVTFSRMSALVLGGLEMVTDCDENFASWQ
jgi:hypothetical protein